MNTTRTMRKPCFKGEDSDGFASIPTNNNNNNNNNNNINYIIKRRNSLRNISCSSTSTTLVYSPRSTLTFTPPLHSPHFLESCSLCRKPLGANRDIFMYRGDTPFCSEECRQEQIEIDESKEKSWGLKKMMRSKNESRSSKGQNNYPVRTSTVAAA